MMVQYRRDSGRPNKIFCKYLRFLRLQEADKKTLSTCYVDDLGMRSIIQAACL